MRALGRRGLLPLFLVLGAARGVRLNQRAIAGRRQSGPNCWARCAQRGPGNESRQCPFAQYFEGRYWGWRGLHACGAEDLRVEVSCEGLPHSSFADEVRNQLGGKHVVMIGDSTMRQTYLGLLCLLWEEGLVGNVAPRARENNEHLHHYEWKGFINGSFPELGEGTVFTYVRKDWGEPGPFMRAVLDTADVTVANLGMHYQRPRGRIQHTTTDDQVVHSSTYGQDVTTLIKEVLERGRPGHRAFWRETFACAAYAQDAEPNTSYGCAREGNAYQAEFNQVVSSLPAYDGIAVLRTQDLLSEFWWAHPGGHDCCHLVGSVPGLLSGAPRLLVAHLALGEGEPGAEAAATSAATALAQGPGCPALATVCESAPLDLWKGPGRL